MVSAIELEPPCPQFRFNGKESYQEDEGEGNRAIGISERSAVFGVALNAIISRRSAALSYFFHTMTERREEEDNVLGTALRFSTRSLFCSQSTGIGQNVAGSQ